MYTQKKSGVRNYALHKMYVLDYNLYTKNNFTIL